MAENIEQLYDNLKGNFLFDFENQDEFKNFLETNPEADKTMSEMFGVENASALLKKKEDVSISSSPSVGVETAKVVASPTMGMEKEAGAVNLEPVKPVQPKPIRQPSAYNKGIEFRDFQAHQELTRSLLKSAQKNDSAGIKNAQLQLERLRASNPNIASDPLLNEDLKIANKFIKTAPTQDAQQKFNFQKQVIEGPKPSKSERVKAFDEFSYNSKLPERTAMEVQADEQKLDLQLQKDADQVLKFGNWNDKNVTEANDEGFLFKNDNGIVEINPLYTGKKIESYVNSAVDIPKELKGVVTQRLTRLVENKLEEKFLMEGAKKKLEEKLSKEGRTLEDIQRAPVLAISAVESVVNNSKKTVSDFDKTNINYIEGELNKIKEQNNLVIDPLLKNIQNRINNKSYGSKEEYEAEYAQYVNAVSEANKKTESAKANLFEGYKQKRQELVENVQKQRGADLEKINKQYGIEMENGQLKLKDYNKMFEESMNDFQSERENQRTDAQSWEKIFAKYPLDAFQRIGGTLVDRVQAGSARVFDNSIQALSSAVGTENNPLTGALKYLDYVQAKSKSSDMSFSKALESGSKMDVLQSIVDGVVDQVPNLSLGISAGILTQNPWIAGSVGWSQDTVDQIGEAYKQKFKQTGSVDEARDAAGETLKVQTAMFPLYAVQFAPFSKGFLSTAKGFTAKAIASDVVNLGRTELLPEITTEIIQNFKSDQLAGKLYNKETGKNMGIGEYFALNGGKISLDVLPSVLAMSGSAVISQRLGEVSTAKAIDKLKSSLGQRGLGQSMADAIDVMGENSVKIVPEYLYRTGNIDAQEFVEMKKNMDELIKTYPSVRNLIGNEDKSRYYLDLMLEKKNTETAMADPKNEATKESYQKRIDELSKTMDNLVNNKNVEDYTVFTAKDGFKYVTGNQNATNILIRDKNAINSVISGDLNVESNDSKIQNEIDKLKKMKGPQTITGLEGGTNINAATATDQEAVQRVKEDTNRDAVEFDNLVQEVNAAQETLNSKFPGVNIVMHTPNSYNKKMKEVEGRENSNGNFTYSENKDGSYSVEIQLNMGTADTKTIAHEVSHGVMLADFGLNPKAFDDMKSKLEAIVSDSDNQKLNDFIANYQESEKSEEYLAELFGIMRTEGTKLNPSVLSRIAQLFNDIVGKLTNGKIIPFKDINDTQQVVDYFNNIADSFKPKTQTNAIQEQTTSQVPVQPETTGSQENAQGQSQAEPQVVTEENQKEEVDFGTAFSMQEATAEETVGKQKDLWGEGQFFREKIENAGDILRELSSRGTRPDPNYLKEKINKLKQWVSKSKSGFTEIPAEINTTEEFRKSNLRFSDAVDSWNYTNKFHGEVLNKVLKQYEAISTYTPEQRIARDLVVDLIKNNTEGLETKISSIEDTINKIVRQGGLPIVKEISLGSTKGQEEILAQSLDNPITTENVEGRQIEPGYEVFDENKTIDVQSSKTNRGPSISSKAQIQRDFKLEDTDFVDPETIDGKTMMGFLGDLQLAGTVTSPTGVELDGRGGPGFTKWANRNIQIDPATGLYEGRAALWASTFEDSTTKLANKMQKVDGSLIGAQQKTGVLGNVKMLNYFTDELSNAIKSGSASEKQILEIINKPLDSSMSKVPLRDYLKLEGVEFDSVEEMNAYLNPFVSTEEFKNRFGKNKNVDKVSYEFRANYFSKIFNITNHEKFNLPSLATGKGYTYDKTVLDYANDSLFENAGYGDFVGYLTYDPASIKVEKVSEDSEFYNPSYPYVITAEKVGMKFFNNFLDGRAIFYDVKPVSATANQTPFGLREKDQAARAIMGAMPISDFDAKKIAERQKEFQSKSQLNPDNIGTQYQADIAANKTKNEALSNLFKAGYKYDDIARKLGEVTFSQQDWNNMVSEDAKEVAKKISDAKIQSQENIRNFITEPNNAILPLEILREKLLEEGYSNPQILKSFEDLDIAEQGEIDELFGKDYRETIKNALNTEEYSEYFNSLTSDERSAKTVKRESDLRTEAEMSGINLLDGIVYVENVANELEAGGLLAAAQMLRDKIANNEVDEDVSNAIKTLAKIQSIAGRLLYINRGLFSSPDKLSNMLSESIIKGGVVLSPFQKEKVKVLIDNFNTTKQNTEKSLQTFEETFTDDDFNQYEKDKKNFDNASKELIKFLESLKPKFWNDRVTSAGSRALLGFQTVFLSLYANVEQAILSDNIFFKGVQSLGDMKGIKTNTVNPQLLLDSYRFSWDKSKQEMVEMFKYGNQADSDFIEKYMDSMANINFFDDVKLAKNFVFNLLGKVGGKKITEMTDEEFADAFDQALYKTKDGKLKLVDGKTYTAARSIFWGLFGSVPEFTGRAMAFGGDKLLANATTYRAMLDYFTTQDLSKGYFGDFVSDGSQIDEKTLQKLIVLVENTLGNENFFEQEGLQRVFLADNFASRNLGSARGKLRKKIKQKAKEIREGEGSQINKVLAKQGLQITDTTLWTLAPFARVPWNVVMAANQKVNPLAASIFYYSSARKYDKAKLEFDSKYGEVVKFKNNDEKMQYEKDRIQLFGLKRQMTYDQACILESTFVFGLAASAYAAGALIPALLPGDDEETALARRGFKSGSYNRTIHWEYLKALYNGKEKDFFIKRGTWLPGDNVTQFSNMGLVGYGFGSYASAGRGYENLKAGNRNKLTPEQVAANLLALSSSQFLFAGAQQLPMLQGIARVGQLVSDGDFTQFAASTSATALSFTSPGLFSFVSKGNAETVQSLNQVNLKTEDLNIIGDVLGEVGVKMIQKLNRNVSFIAKNQFYEAKIGPYGEDLQFRTTNANPGTLGAYVETIFNPFASRKIGLQDAKRETQRYRFAVGINANMYQLSQAYRELTGGTIAQKPNMTIEGDLVSVLTKEIPNDFKLESNGVYLEYNLPNDMYRNELKKRGDILYNLHQDVYQKSIDNINYLKNFYKDEQNKKQAMGNIEQLFANYKNQADQADGSWMIDYKQSREKANLLEMKRRGVLDETQLDKLRQIYGNF